MEIVLRPAQSHSVTTTFLSNPGDAGSRGQFAGLNTIVQSAYISRTRFRPSVSPFRPSCYRLDPIGCAIPRCYRCVERAEIRGISRVDLSPN